MILADTNIFIDFWNNPTKEIIDTFDKEEIVICGVIKAELLHGSVSDKDFSNIVSMLEAFDELYFYENDWQLLGNNLYKMRKSGLTVPLSDAIIATIAIKNSIPIWTEDRHFSLIQNVLGGFKLFHHKAGY